VHHPGSAASNAMAIAGLLLPACAASIKLMTLGARLALWKIEPDRATHTTL
jgi:hypothetical protein